MSDIDLAGLFSQGRDSSMSRMFELLNDPDVSQIVVNRYDRVFYVNERGTNAIDRVFVNSEAYINWLNELMTLTDVGYTDINNVMQSVIEGSFDVERTNLHGSIHIATKELTRGDPALTIRKQPAVLITLDNMLSQGMMNEDMRNFLELAVRGRANILVSGGSGAGKTTLARALSYYIEPSQRVVTVEEIDELHLHNRLPNAVSLTTYQKRDEQGQIVRRVDLEDLVRESLRMRADRIWVGETRGKEAYALVKACNSGHDGSCTTIHADSGAQAIKQLVTYVMESGLAEEVARDQVAQGFHLVVQLERVRMGQRAVTQLIELEAVREGSEQRRNVLYQYNHETGYHEHKGSPSPRLRHDWARYGVNISELGFW